VLVYKQLLLNQAKNLRGMFQVAELKQSSNFTSVCGTGGQGFAAERMVNGHMVCNFYKTFTFGANHRLAILANPSCGGWCAYVDGSVIDGPWNTLGMPNGGYAVARAEAKWTSDAPYYDVTWGPSGYTPWQYTNTNGQSYTTIGTSYSVRDDLGWTLQGTPSPFAIYR
jgi:hypothetical protein